MACGNFHAKDSMFTVPLLRATQLSLAFPADSHILTKNFHVVIKICYAKEISN